MRNLYTLIFAAVSQFVPYHDRPYCLTILQQATCRPDGLGTFFVTLTQVGDKEDSPFRLYTEFLF